jgi:replication factor C small subunit
MLEEAVWSEKYRPKTIKECILPDRLKDLFQKYVTQGTLPQMILQGSAGTGKTTVARALCNELDADVMIINASLQNGIDVLRNQISQFATTVSLTGRRKYLIIDEADGLTRQMQEGLRAFIEEHSKNVGFILTCNYINKIIDPIQSRAPCIDFALTTEEKKDLGIKFISRLFEILDKESVPYDKKSVAGVVKKYFPDWRQCLNRIQTYAANGKIDSGILVEPKAENLDYLFQMMKDKKFSEVRKWVSENRSNIKEDLFMSIYQKLPEKISPAFGPGAVVLVGKYYFQHQQVINPEINFAAMLAELMLEIAFL